MRAEHTARLRRQLLAARNRLGHTVADLQQDACGQTPRNAGFPTSLPSHFADLGSDVFEQELDLELMAVDLRRIEAIDEALERIEAGTYGACLQCGDPIELRRLEVLPEAALCLACQELAAPDHRPSL